MCAISRRPSLHVRVTGSAFGFGRRIGAEYIGGLGGAILEALVPSRIKQHMLNRKKKDPTPVANRAKSADVVVWLTGKARALEEAALERCSQQLNALIKLIKPWAPMRGYRLADEYGQPAKSDRAE